MNLEDLPKEVQSILLEHPSLASNSDGCTDEETVSIEWISETNDESDSDDEDETDEDDWSDDDGEWEEEDE